MHEVLWTENYTRVFRQTGRHPNTDLIKDTKDKCCIAGCKLDGKIVGKEDTWIQQKVFCLGYVRKVKIQYLN